MKKFFLFLLFLLFSAPISLRADSLVEEEDISFYRQAFEEMNKKSWDYAKIIASNGTNDILNKYIDWRIYSTFPPQASFEEMTNFIRKNQNWPSLIQIRKNAELAIDNSVSEAELEKWFRVYPPLTGKGMIKYANILFKQGKKDEATKLIRKAWREGEFCHSEENAFINRYGDRLRSTDHKERFDRLIWERKMVEAKSVLNRLRGNEKLIAKARYAIATKKEPNKNLNNVPKKLRTREDLLYERIRYRRQRNDFDGALELIKTPNFGKGGHSSRWYNELYRVTLYLLDKEYYSKAYKLISKHPFKKGETYSEAEWFSGFIALRFTKKPQKALTHFMNFNKSVQSPISKAKASYWLARTYEAMKQPEKAKEWYKQASAYPSAFYGQIARKKLGLPLEEMPTTTTRRAEIEILKDNELVKTIIAIDEIGNEKSSNLLASKVFYSLKEIKEVNALIAIMQELERYDIIVHLTRNSRRKGHEVGKTGYPILNYETVPNIEKALTMAIIRQESSFETTAISSAGAMGLMQLMPSTAKKMSQALNQQFLKSKLTDNPRYNVLLGTKYLEILLQKYNNHYVPVIAAYNAGETAVNRWRKIRGNPWEKNDEEAVIDWIELIPYNETRNYVHRVLENLNIYRLMLDNKSANSGTL